MIKQGSLGTKSIRYINEKENSMHVKKIKLITDKSKCVDLF